MNIGRTSSKLNIIDEESPKITSQMHFNINNDIIYELSGLIDLPSAVGVDAVAT